MRQRPCIRVAAAGGFAVAGLFCLGLCVLPAQSPPNDEAPPPRSQANDELPPPLEQPKQPGLTIGTAVNLALRLNPALNTFRKNRGIAQAAVQIARQYPFNPILQHFVWGNWGPAAAGITNHLFQEHTSRLDLEINGQGKYRRATAHYALTRTEWEIAAQELLTSILVVRGYNTLLYRQGKYRLLEEGLQLTEQTHDFIRPLVEQGTLRSADLLLARADVVEARNTLGPGRGLAVVAENDLRRGMGLLNEGLVLEGTLEKDFEVPQVPLLIQAALERRPDLHALAFAVQEAENRLRFEVANRWGNPSLGPAGEVNETSVGFVGMWLIWSPPIINTRKGEIRQRQAELARAVQALHQGEVLAKQDVFAGVARLEQAQKVVKYFDNELLPVLRQTREEMDKLYTAAQPGVDLTRILDIRRRLLRARDAYLDALWELSQAQTDLAAAVADLSFAGCRAVAPPSEAERSNESAPAQQPSTGEQLPPPTPVPGPAPAPGKEAPKGEQLLPPNPVPGK